MVVESIFRWRLFLKHSFLPVEKRVERQIAELQTALYQGELDLEEPRDLDIKIFDTLFRWGHPNSDFGSQVLDAYLSKHSLKIIRKHWAPH